MKKETIKKASLNVVLLLVFFTGAFIVAEGVVRLLFKGDVVLFPRYHTDAQYGEFSIRTIRPNSVFWHTSVDGSWQFETNAQGFRNREDFTYEKPPGVVRVLSLGDSHTQGYEVRQDFTFSAVIEKYLESHGYEAQVMNTGVSGFSTAEALVLLENEGIKYDPDFVVLGFYANDFEDNIKAGLFGLDEDGSLTIAKKRHLPGVRAQNLIYSLPTVKWLSENSYFYSLLFNHVWEFFKAQLARDAAAAVDEYAIPTTEYAVPTTEYAVPTTVDDSSYDIELTAALLESMHRYCAQQNIPLIIIDIPRISGGSSFPSSLAQRVQEFSDAYVDGSKLLADYSDVAEIHLPHGNRHISEFSHVILGVDAAERIESWLRGAATDVDGQ